MFKKYNFIENKYISNFIKKVQRQLTDNVNEVDCFICFMPSEKNNQINKLSKFSVSDMTSIENYLKSTL